MAAHLDELRTVNNYFDLDDILASQEKIPCVFNIAVEGLGYLDQSTNDPNISVGTKLELPFWLAKYLNRDARGIVAVETPKNYREGYRQILAADPSVVDLHRLGPHFYLFGGKLAILNLPDNQDVLNTLLQTFQGRFRRIMDGAQNALHSDLTSQTDMLDESELNLFAAGQRGLVGFQQWESRESEKLSTSTMVVNQRKRKWVSSNGDAGD
ncbi:DNA replication complex gins protein psf3-like [Plakobranchus ocellatus]|uniref:DNA replication complex GINS protein PSF3 n=1 Tax=Plakobranchus ocellatus TaxID=259542 RepID=A0AAV3Y7V2_9GAST|nr:DNA replication complex gins protein psf3-like [Plakobranchus ocellatus]